MLPLIVFTHMTTHSFVVLTHVTTHSSESTDSSIMNLLYTNTLVCDFENSTQRFRSLAPLMTSDGRNFYNTGSWVFSKNITDKIFERVLDTETLNL